MPQPCERYEETRREVEELLGEQKTDRIKRLREQMKILWKGRSIQGYFTLHDSSHSEGVECALYKLIRLDSEFIPIDGISILDSDDWFLLIAAAWIHDIGMLPKILQNDEINGETLEDFESAREKHHLRSGQYINENFQLLGLTSTERDHLSVICEYHRKSVDINKCPNAFNKNLRLLAAYFRLADGIHINHERVNDDLFSLFELIGMPEESRFHWMKSKLTSEVIPNPDPKKLTIDVHLNFSHLDNKDSALVSNLIRDDIRNELYSVRDILIKGGISYYLDVQVIESEIPADQNTKLLLQQMINNIQLDSWASASDVFNSIVSTILYLSTFPDKVKAIETLRRYQERIIKKNLKIRTCHVMLDKIYTLIDASLAATTSLEPKRVLDNLKEEMNTIKTERTAAFNKIAQNAKPILSDGEPILLFGHSKIVIAALALLDENLKRSTEIYICEGRNSGRYSYLNEIDYCDGLEYACAIKELGFSNVILIPDILVGNLLGRVKNNIRKIVFGANGIDLHEASFGHTAGHLAIAKLGRLYGVPVYVLADCFKFGELKYDEVVERNNNWLMGEGSINYSRLKGIKVYNPREDKVCYDDITYLITEQGMFPPLQMPKTIGAKYSDYLDKVSRFQSKIEMC